MMTTTPTTTPAAIPATFVPPEPFGVTLAEEVEVFVFSGCADSVTTTVLPGWIVVTTVADCVEAEDDSTAPVGAEDD